MSLDRIRLARKRLIGTNQTTKALQQQMAVTVIYVAKDAEDKILRPILSLAEERGIHVEWVESMKLLGKACGIDVGAATAAIIEE